MKTLVNPRPQWLSVTLSDGTTVLLPPWRLERIPDGVEPVRAEVVAAPLGQARGG